MATSESLKEPENTLQSPDKAKRERSTILFPYVDLEEAIGIAKGVHTIGGSSCQVDQLAAQLQTPAASSAFQLRLNTARIFGLVMYSQKTVSLTPIGTRVCDPQQEKGARAEAFLNVPLYKAVYEQFKGATLPPASGLDTTMGNLGVAAKQKETARRVLQRSATQAGFFAFGQDRLVYPSIKGSNEATPSANSETPHDVDGIRKNTGGGGGGGGDGGDGSRHPLIEGLIKALPAGGVDWPLEARKKWLQAAAINFELVYADSAGDQGSLKVSVEREGSAK